MKELWLSLFTAAALAVFAACRKLCTMSPHHSDECSSRV